MRAVVEKQEANTFTEFSVLEEWDDLLLLTGQVNFDHLFVVVSARKALYPIRLLLSGCRLRLVNILQMPAC